MTLSLLKMGRLSAFALGIACAGISFGASAAPAATEESAIVVAQQVAMEAWSKDINHALDRRLRQTSKGIANGIVQLRFTLDSDGRPENMTLYRSSGRTSIDRAALRAVRGLEKLDEAPVRNLSETTFQANIIFASNIRSFEQYAEELRKSEVMRLARGDKETSIVSFGG